MCDQARSPQPPTVAGRECSLADKVAWLRGLLGPGDEAIETHFAWVFLAGDRAWKLRKPVRRDTMDYGTIEARRLDSEAEVSLNRRLAPHAYLGARPLTRGVQGRLAIGGSGDIVDWLVEMRRLDRARMLDAVLARGAADVDDLRRVAALLARFYAGEPAAVTDGGALQARLQAQVEANHRVLATLDAATALAVRDAQLASLGARRAWLDARAAGGCVIEAHGDLRPEHVLLDDPPAVIDCLEFDRNLRIMDRAEELAFLELECGRLGAPEAGRLIARECLARLADHVPHALACFYRGHRAATRAKLCVWRATEPDGGPPPHWQATARSYLAAALDASREAVRLSAA
jgi:aminoglycoside phosphotransferase family enzyme